VIQALALAAALGICGWQLVVRARPLVARARAAPRVARQGQLGRRLRRELSLVLGQRRLLARPGPGLLHAFIFWGFLVLLPTILIALIGAVDRRGTLPWLGAQGVYILLSEIFALLVLVGVLGALWIRKAQRPKRFEGSHLAEADLILALIALIVVSLLLWHATRIALGLNEWPRSQTPISAALSHIFARDQATRVLERVFVWVHVLTILGFAAYLPRSKHLHIATAPLNVWLASTGAAGRLEPLVFDDPDVPEDKVRLGATSAAQLTVKGVLDALSCTECGRCQDVCPAWATGKVLSPKLVIMGLRDALAADDGAPLVGGTVAEEAVWDCVTCGACVAACPVGIEHVDQIVDLRRALVMEQSRFPPEAEPMLRDVERSSNPWGHPQSARADWAVECGVRVLADGEQAPEYLYWVGCAASFDERARRGAQATARLLARAGVDFAILGPRESCTGDPARRIGNEYVFQELAQRNVATLTGAGVRKIIASCPHCFNTLANEYPDFGGRFEVIHHSQLLAALMREGRLEAPGERGLALTYHDSCYLARHNDVLQAPRELAGAVGQLREMRRNRANTFCCGAGGAHMWMEERGNPINAQRVSEAAATGADTLAVACPFCAVMLDDGVRSTGAPLRVADIATLLDEALDGRSRTAYEQRSERLR